MTELYEIPGHYNTYYTAKSLKKVWQNISKETLDALEIRGEGEYKISFQRQFETHYRDMSLRHQDLEWGEVTFFIILEENKMIINQIKRIQDEIVKLEKPESWRSETLLFSYTKANSDSTATVTQGGFSNSEVNSTDSGKDSTHTSNINYVATQSGVTDSNSKVDLLEDLESLDAGNKEGKTLREKVIIPDKPLELLLIPNQLNQGKNLNIIDKELELSKGTSNETVTVTSSSAANLSENKYHKENVMVGKNTNTNTAMESLQYLRAEIPFLRSKFLNAFSALFNV